MKKLLVLISLCVTLYSNAQTPDSTFYKQQYKNRVNLGIGLTSLGVGLVGLGFALPRYPKEYNKPGTFTYFGAPIAAAGIYFLFSAIGPCKKYRVATGKNKKTALYFAPEKMSLTYNF